MRRASWSGRELARLGNIANTDVSASDWAGLRGIEVRLTHKKQISVPKTCFGAARPGMVGGRHIGVIEYRRGSCFVGPVWAPRSVLRRVPTGLSIALTLNVAVFRSRARFPREAMGHSDMSGIMIILLFAYVW